MHFAAGMGSVRLDDVNFTEPSSYNKWTSYGQSKTANIWMANAIDRRYGAQNLHALSVHPGRIMTELGRHMTDDDMAFLGGLEDMQKWFKSPEQGAATTVWAAVSPHFEGGNGGRYLEDVGEAGPIAEGAVMGSPGYGKHAYDPDGEDKLWKLSCETVGVPVEN